MGPTLATGKQGWDKLIGRAVAGFPSHRPGKQEEKAAKPPRSSLPSFIRRTLIFSLMSVSCRSGQKQSSAGAITTSRGIPQNTLCLTYTHTHTQTDGNVLVLLLSGMERPPCHTKKCQNKQTEVLLRELIEVRPQSESKNPKSTKLLLVLKYARLKSAVPVPRR